MRRRVGSWRRIGAIPSGASTRVIGSHLVRASPISGTGGVVRADDSRGNRSRSEATSAPILGFLKSNRESNAEGAE